MAIPIEIQKKLNALAYKYAPRFEASVRDTFNSKKLKDAGLLAASIKAVVIPANNEEAAHIVLKYLEHGEFIGSRKLLFTKQPPLWKMHGWLLRQYGHKFKPKTVPGYKPGSIPKISKEKQLKRVAYAVALKLRYRQKLTRRYKWKKASLPDVLRPMNQELIAEWVHEVEQIIAKSLST